MQELLLAVARGLVEDKDLSLIHISRAQFGFDADTCAVISNIDGQSPDIALGTNDQVGGAGDQGKMCIRDRRWAAQSTTSGKFQ